MLTFGPYAQLGLIVTGFWLFTVSLALVCIVAGTVGDRIARRHGRKCPDCDYRSGPVDMTIHRIQEHERER